MDDKQLREIIDASYLADDCGDVLVVDDAFVPLMDVSSCCGRRLTSYWHLTYCNPRSIVKVRPGKVPPREELPSGQMVLDHDHLPPHLRLHNRMYLQNRRPELPSFERPE